MKNKQKEAFLRLKRENAELRRENEYLKHRIESISPKAVRGLTQERELFLSSADVDKYGGYFRYLMGRFKFSLVYRIYDRIFFALRKILLASRIWRYLPMVLGALGVVLQVLLALGIAVVLLPVCGIAVLVLLAVSALELARHGRERLCELKGKRVYFLFPAKRPKKDGFFCANMRELARDGIVFAVTPSVSLCGFGAVRRVCEGVYFIHTSFYYHFRKKAEAQSAEVIKIY